MTDAEATVTVAILNAIADLRDIIHIPEGPEVLLISTIKRALFESPAKWATQEFLIEKSAQQARQADAPSSVLGEGGSGTLRSN